MTDITALAQELYNAVNQQLVPEEVTKSDLSTMIVEAIKDLYVISGRTFSWADDKVTYDAGIPITFADTLAQDEQRWVLLKAQILFYRWVQASVNTLTGYSTDAMSVTNSDKPYANLGQTIAELTKDMNVIWTRMVRFNHLGVVG